MLNYRRLSVLLCAGVLPGLLIGLLVLGGCRTQPAPPNDTAAAAPQPDTPAATVGLFPLTVSDDLGASLTFPQAPRRIISLAPSLTELLFTLGLGERVVGVTNYCKYPPEAQQKEKVGGYVDASEEKIVSLSPDVIFATRGTPRTFMDSLRGAGLKVYALQQDSFSDVVSSIEKVGRVCGVAAEGRRLADELQQTRDEIATRTASLGPSARPRALMVVSLEPLFVAGPGSYQDEMLSVCGARNVAGISHSFGNLSLEAVVQAAPEVIVMVNDENGTRMTREQQLKRLGASPAWRGTPAVKNGRVYVIEVSHLSMPGPRLAKGLTAMARAVHPELFAAK